MSAYRLHLGTGMHAMTVDTCHDCGPDVEYPSAELLSCPHCPDAALYCSFHSIRDLDTCRHPDCVIKAATGLRLANIDKQERMTAALVVLDEAHNARLHICAQRKVRAAIQVLRGD